MCAPMPQRALPLRCSRHEIGLDWSEEHTMIETAQLESTAITGSERQPEAIQRLTSMDAFRGLVMTLMLGEVMHLPEVARSFPQNWLWNIIAFNTQHVEWQG